MTLSRHAVRPCALLLGAAFVCAPALHAAEQDLTVPMLKGECWWGLSNDHGSKMPYTAVTGLRIDNNDGGGNQSAAFLVSNRGRHIWCDKPVVAEITNGVIRVATAQPGASVELVEAGHTLRDAYLDASRRHFPPCGEIPDELFFTAPQYNTWVELTYHQNERDILAYAQSMLDNGLPPGILMIDDTWQTDYGVWEFEPRRFPDPKGMVAKLHAKGFKVMVWLCPWVSMDSVPFRELAWGVRHDSVRPADVRGGFFRDAAGEPVACRWWNGYSALLDFSDPIAVAWFAAQCERLRRDYGIDGFKFDGGNAAIYRGLAPHAPGKSPCELSRLYSAFAERYPVNEYRCAWQMAARPVVMRLYDKGHKWEELRELIPQMLAGGLLGHQFICPDMIGGGSWVAFLPDAPVDQDLIVRSAQVHALCGMMQFSVSPWRVLDAEHQQAVRAAVATRQKFASRILDLARRCAKSGEPMIRSLEYAFPANGYESVKDEFALGDFLIVAPQLEKGGVERTVLIPPGRWTADDGTVYVGPKSVVMKTPLARLPHLIGD